MFIFQYFSKLKFLDAPFIKLFLLLPIWHLYIMTLFLAFLIITSCFTLCTPYPLAKILFSWSFNYLFLNFTITKFYILPVCLILCIFMFLGIFYVAKTNGLLTQHQFQVTWGFLANICFRGQKANIFTISVSCSKRRTK